jgi:hypothetical protein
MQGGTDCGMCPRSKLLPYPRRAAPTHHFTHTRTRPLATTPHTRARVHHACSQMRDTRARPARVPAGARRPSCLDFSALPLPPDDTLSAEADGRTAARAADALPWLRARGGVGAGVGSGRGRAGGPCTSAWEGGGGWALLRRVWVLYFFERLCTEGGQRRMRMGTGSVTLSCQSAHAGT